MSKASKTVLAIATVLVVGGFAISFGAFAAAGFNPENLSTEARNWVSNTKSFPLDGESPISSLVLRDGGQNVRVEATDGDAVEVEYWTNEHKRFDFAEHDGTIAIEGVQESYIGIMMMGSFEDHSTVVKVPRSYTGALSVDVGAGNLKLAGLSELSTLSLTAGGGSIDASHVSAEAIVLKAGAGSIELSDALTRRVTAELAGGNVTMTDVKASDGIASNTSVGNQMFTRVQAPSIRATTSGGDVYATELDVDDLVAETSVGSIFAIANGLESDYRIEASASVGDVNAPHGNDSASKSIVLRTSGGDIDLGFSGDPSVSSMPDTSSGSTAPSSPSAPSAPAAPAAPDAPAAPETPAA